ncbi:hypothetical protein KEM52_004927 [Ascosphaera acerosa]|nr:hypothetical protein KEM52_004927 [Ascosphaera acerosa]
MGCAASRELDPEEKAAAKANATIDRMIRNDKKVADRTVKILLLGAGESGKSTIIKQMRIIHTGGFPEDERRQTKAVIYSNLVVAFKVILDIMETARVGFTLEQSESFASLIKDTEPDVDVDEAFADLAIKNAMTGLWDDGGVQQAVARGHDYFESIDRLFEPNWLPNNNDMLHARLRTTGITETLFELEHANFRMMDVGGQRSERKKWIHCFEGVNCLLFMVALSGYDQCLLEDQTANQMHEAMMLFEALVNGDWFKTKPVILFLNKVDLFKAKLDKSPIHRHFPDFQCPEGNYAVASAYFADKFKNMARLPDREVYHHFTNATDTTLLSVTMKSVQDMIIQKNLNDLIL